jgi:hypothetical protein
MFGLPIIFSAIRLALFCFFYKEDTPVSLLIKGNEGKAKKVL